MILSWVAWACTQKGHGETLASFVTPGRQSGRTKELGSPCGRSIFVAQPQPRLRRREWSHVLAPWNLQYRLTCVRSALDVAHINCSGV